MNTVLTLCDVWEINQTNSFKSLCLSDCDLNFEFTGWQLIENLQNCQVVKFALTKLKIYNIPVCISRCMWRCHKNTYQSCYVKDSFLDRSVYCYNSISVDTIQPIIIMPVTNAAKNWFEIRQMTDLTFIRSVKIWNILMCLSLTETKVTK